VSVSVPAAFTAVFVVGEGSQAALHCLQVRPKAGHRVSRYDHEIRRGAACHECFPSPLSAFLYRGALLMSVGGRI